MSLSESAAGQRPPDACAAPMAPRTCVSPFRRAASPARMSAQSITAARPKVPPTWVKPSYMPPG